MNLADFLSSDAYTPVNKALARRLWFVCAWFLWELIRKREHFGWWKFYYSQEDMEKELWISAYVQRWCIDKLVEVWYLIVEKEWIPCRNWYTLVDMAIFNSFDPLDNKMWRNLTTGCEETWQQGVEKLDNYIIRNNSKKWNKKNSDVWKSDLNTALEEFKAMRKMIKKPLTSEALKRIVAKLDKLWKNDEEKIAILNQSVDHCWQGVFPLQEPLITEPQTNREWVEFFDKCWENKTERKEILDKYWREKFEKVKKIWSNWCVTKQVDENFIL